MTSRSLLRRLAALVALALGIVSCGEALAAQQPRDSALFRGSDATILGVSTVGAVLLMQRDQAITEWFRQSSLQQNSALKGTLTGARLFGDPGSLIISGAMWAGGRAFDNKTLELDGQYSFEAVAVSSVATFILKGLAGRARPYADSTNANNFAFGRGIKGDGAYQSFPSGHATAAFAFASAMTARIERRNPKDAKWIGPLLYGAATLTAISRVYDHKHWASDVLLGAGIGTVGGLMTVRWHDRHP